ncbi:hypothetical protein NPX13_g6644 [Xylaria arbuscula]|uniref:Uncharacterized protein n=1 Tax=Xylaria arbuscula TaxID=114810 RepID=A0A9W8NCH2_9PEZI|nr:hypothetical protein NPX13_g6644 [Xylaria arbuscula]
MRPSMMTREEDKTGSTWPNPGQPGTTIAADRQLPDFLVWIGWDRKTGLWSCRSVELRSRVESRRCAVAGRCRSLQVTFTAAACTSSSRSCIYWASCLEAAFKPTPTQIHNHEGAGNNGAKNKGFGKAGDDVLDVQI